MTFNLFGPPTKDDIRVGYIDPDRGLVEGVTICQANDYAIKNPGTTFIFKNGNNTLQYLNVNEINKLDPNVLVSTDKCDGINQKKECGPPRIQLFGGGGVGAAGNPIIGRDGAILAVDVVRGGNGYQYPPLVAARDDCNYGAGATLTAVLGEVTETIETYENESDFEDYELCEPTDVGYGRRYGPDGEDLGPWEPQSYTEPGEDPIRKEVEEFEKIVRRLARAPFWTTRNSKPTKITCSDTSVIPSKYDVTDASFLERQRKDGVKNPVGWNEFMNSYAISPIAPSNVRGTDYAGRLFTFQWTEDFPLDGEYIFRGLCDNQAQLYVDNLKVADLGSFANGVRPIKKSITKGIHNVRVDLLNVPITETIKTTSSVNFVDVDFNVYGQGDNTSKINFSFISEDGSHSFAIKGVDKSRGTRTDKIKVKPNTNYKVTASTSKPKANVEQGIIKNGTKNKEGGLESSNKIFADQLRSVNDNDDMQITALSGIFTPSNKRKTSSKGRSTYDLTFRINSGQQSNAQQSATVEVVSSKSWNENPMGVSLTIDAPEPIVPKEPAPVQEGRCPPNPIWTTRFPGAKETWYPVKFNGSKSPQGKKEPWAKFFNRYAISPIKPLDTPGSDGGGVLFTNSWEIDIPYDGFYKFAVQRDETARIYLDGKIAFDIKTSGDDIWKDFRDQPKFQKVFITKGRHTIGIELENSKTETFSQVSQKIFRTKDWQTPATPASNTIDVNFNVKTAKSSRFASVFKIPDLNINISKPVRGLINQTIPKKVEVGKVYIVEIEVSQSKNVTLKIKGQTLEVEDLSSNTPRDLYCTISNGRFFDIVNGRTKATCKFVVDSGSQVNLTGLTGGTAKDGVTYEGPPLFAYKDNRWGEFMNNHSVSPLLPPLNAANPAINGIKKYVWRKVKFPESGQYDIAFQADNDASLIINGIKVLGSQGFEGIPQFFKVNITQGTYNIIVECNNVPDRTNIFNNNPTGFGVVIRKNVNVRNDYGKSWDENPMGVGAILIPPPCPKRIRGKGVVTDIIVNDPGNGYVPPIPFVSVPSPPVSVASRKVARPPSTVPTVPTVPIVTPTTPPTTPPVVPSITAAPAVPTGVNASFRPQFEVIRDPVVIDSQKIIQVTDLVGLKQTGYVNGRPYYGAVFYKNNIRYAGFYETPGTLVQVYDTLKESIDAEVTTQPSAILRQGTDIRSNDPKLNIPGTLQSSSLSETSTLSTTSNESSLNVDTPSVSAVQEINQDPSYPVALRLKSVIIENPGINYNTVDQIRITPDNGAILKPLFGPFGIVIGVEIIDPGFGFTEYPTITMFTPS